MAKYRIVTNGSWFAVQRKVLWFFWVFETTRFYDPRDMRDFESRQPLWFASKASAESWIEQTRRQAGAKWRVV